MTDTADTKPAAEPSEVVPAASMPSEPTPAAIVAAPPEMAAIVTDTPAENAAATPDTPAIPVSPTERPAAAKPSGLSALKARLAGHIPPMAKLRRPALAAAAAAVAVGLGFGGAKLAGSSSAELQAAVTQMGEASAELRQGQEGVARMGAELKAIKAAVDGRKGGDPAVRQLAERVEKGAAETGARLGRLADQVERMEKTQRDPARIAAITERLDRLEAKLAVAQPVAAAAPTPPPKPVASAPEPTQTGSLPEARVAAKPEPDPRRTQLDGYVLRDIEDGMALIEGRNGKYYEVAPGMNLPGVGRVEGIERRGRNWVVVTPKGFIAER